MKTPTRKRSEVKAEKLTKAEENRSWREALAHKYEKARVERRKAKEAEAAEREVAPELVPATAYVRSGPARNLDKDRSLPGKARIRARRAAKRRQPVDLSCYLAEDES